MNTLRTPGRLAATALLSGAVVLAVPATAYAHGSGDGGRDHSGSHAGYDGSGSNGGDGRQVGWDRGNGGDHDPSGHGRGGHGRHHGDCDSTDGSTYRVAAWSEHCDPDGNGDGGVGVGVSERDAAYLQDNAQTSVFEMISGFGAIVRSDNTDVQMLGAHLLVDHANAYVMVAQLDRDRGLEPPAAPSADQQDVLMQLSQLEGDAFDCAFIPVNIQGHEAAIEKSQDEADNGDDPQIRQFAEAQIPILEDHLQMAEQAEATLECA